MAVMRQTPPATMIAAATRRVRLEDPAEVDAPEGEVIANQCTTVTRKRPAQSLGPDASSGHHRVGRSRRVPRLLAILHREVVDHPQLVHNVEGIACAHPAGKGNGPVVPLEPYS